MTAQPGFLRPNNQTKKKVSDMSMKKSIKSIAKCVLASVGIISFLVLVGEPTEEFYDSADTLGIPGPVAFLAVKAVCIGLAAVCCKAYERIEPGVFDR